MKIISITVNRPQCGLNAWAQRAVARGSHEQRNPIQSFITKISRNTTNISKQYWPIPCYLQSIHVHEVSMMNDVRLGPSYQHFRPRSKQCTEAPIYANSHRNKLYNCLEILVVFLDIFVIKLFSYGLKYNIFILHTPASNTNPAFLTVNATRVLVRNKR
jgi:hypothetical protein